VPAKRDDLQVQELRRLIQRLFRRFGALATDATPCGQPLSIAHAHALMVLLGRPEVEEAFASSLGNLEPSFFADRSHLT
jgi:hypothetical protein